MFIPSLSQHLLMTSVLKDETVRLLDVMVSAAASLAGACAADGVDRTPLAPRNHAGIIETLTVFWGALLYSRLTTHDV